MKYIPLLQSGTNIARDNGRLSNQDLAEGGLQQFLAKPNSTLAQMNRAEW